MHYVQKNGIHATRDMYFCVHPIFIILKEIVDHREMMAQFINTGSLKFSTIGIISLVLLVLYTYLMSSIDLHYSAHFEYNRFSDVHMMPDILTRPFKPTFTVKSQDNFSGII